MVNERFRAKGIIRALMPLCESAIARTAVLEEGT
jgi:hypothetical protein